MQNKNVISQFLIIQELFDCCICLGYHLRWNSRATSVVIGMWCLTIVVFAYAGTLFSFLSVAKLQPIINSLDELANSTQVQLVTQARTLWVGYLMVRTSPFQCKLEYNFCKIINHCTLKLWRTHKAEERKSLPIPFATIRPIWFQPLKRQKLNWCLANTHTLT